MHKEIIISIIVIVAILGLNAITQKNTDNTIQTIQEQLGIVRKDILEKEPNKEVATKHIQEAHDKWEELDDKMAYYIEHNELEKVTTALTSIKSFIEIEEYQQGVESLDRCMYILQHIDDREKFTLDNIF